MGKNYQDRQNQRKTESEKSFRLSFIIPNFRKKKKLILDSYLNFLDPKTD